MKSGSIGVFLFLVMSISVHAQLTKDVFPLNRQYKKSGFYVAPLATISFGNSKEDVFSYADTSYEYKVTGRGKWGYGIELGWFQTFDNALLFDFVEGGLGYRLFQGAAEHEGELKVSNSTIANIKSDNEFKAHTLNAVLRAVKARQIGKHSFLTYALGANFNYLIAKSYDRENSYPNSYESFLNESSLQLHFQLGVGFRLTDKLLMIPTLETPLVTAYPTGKLNPAFPFFEANYHPLIIGLKFMFLREDPVNCNAPQLPGVPTVD